MSLIVDPLCRAEGIPLVGGRRTDLRTGFAKALRAQPPSDVLMVLTDGRIPVADQSAGSVSPSVCEPLTEEIATARTDLPYQLRTPLLPRDEPPD